MTHRLQGYARIKELSLALSGSETDGHPPLCPDAQLAVREET